MAAVRGLRRKRDPVIDVEKHVKPCKHADFVNKLHYDTLQTTFAFSQDQIEQIQKWPCPTHWCLHLENCFKPLLSDQYASAWPGLGLTRPKTTSQCWDVFRAISTLVAKLDDAEHSVEDVLESIQVAAGAHVAPRHGNMPGGARQNESLIVIFAVLCWSSMLHSPELVWSKGAADACLAIQLQPAKPQSLKMDLVERPIPVVFRTLQKAVARRRPIRKLGKEEGTTLFVSTINFHSLQTIGKVSLAWVDDLCSHLSFDSRTRTLSVFRLPGFCACELFGTPRGPMFEEMIKASFSTNDTVMLDNEYSFVQLCQEVLMSYRLLFGQSRVARRSGKSQLEKLKGPHDQLLIYLCARPQKVVNEQLPSSFWPPPCRAFNGDLQEAESYSSQDDFPMLGSRFVVLQEFNLRQQPSRLRDLWRDRRSPLQWYTFWAVLIIGGISNIIAILQLVVAIIQLFSRG